MRPWYLIPCLLGALSFAPGVSADAPPPTWVVQSDYFAERDGVGQPRTIRGLALSADESSVYVGNVQRPNPGSTAVRKVSSAILAVAGTDHVIFGNGMPGGTGTFGPVDGQPVYAGGGTGTFHAWLDVGNSPEGIDTDDRGYVYVALSSGVSSANQVAVLDAGLTTQVAAIPLTGPTGVAVHRVGTTYYAYTASGSGLQRWDVTTFPAVLDPTWAPGVFGARNLAVDADGTAFAVGHPPVVGAASVWRIDPTGVVTHTTSLANAADVAVFQSRIYVVKRQSPTQPIVVLNKADLTSGGPDLVTPELGAFVRGSISQFTSIDVTLDGRLYVSEENYTAGSSGIPSYTPPATSFNPVTGPVTGRVYFDRVLVSSPLADEVAPEITCPADVAVVVPYGQTEAAVDPGTATATDDVDGPVPTVGTRSDSLLLTDPYPLGATTITWTAEDAAGNESSCQQTILVTVDDSARSVKSGVLDELNALSPLPVHRDEDKLQAAIKGLTKSLNVAYWVDDHRLVEATGTKVFDGEKEAAKKLRELSASNGSGLTPAQLDPLIGSLRFADRALATTAIDDAVAATGNAAKIAAAQQHVAKGDAKTKPDEAIEEYKKAWKDAVAAH